MASSMVLRVFWFSSFILLSRAASTVHLRSYSIITTIVSTTFVLQLFYGISMRLSLNWEMAMHCR